MIFRFMFVPVLLLAVFACTARDSAPDAGSNPVVTGIRGFQLAGDGSYNECGEEIGSENDGDLNCTAKEFIDEDGGDEKCWVEEEVEETSEESCLLRHPGSPEKCGECDENNGDECQN